MSKEVTPQVDIGALSVRGLAAFTPLLSALSADDVSPLAVVQLENLGSPFHINGQYARRVPDLLRRCSSTRLDRLSLMIGWRKGDTASFLSQSAGGQAVALMCFCLANTRGQEDIGCILNDLSERLLPNSLARSSLGQLTTLANLLAAKLQAIGFGNILAKEVLRIQEACGQLGTILPSEFFDTTTVESIVGLYHALSKISVDDVVLRISGLSAMSHIMMITLIMFPDNVTITLDNLLLRQGSSSSILLDINTLDREKFATVIQVEERLSVCSKDPTLVRVREDTEHLIMPYHFTWSGHVTDALRLMLAEIGIVLPDSLVVACCNMLLALVQPVPAELPFNSRPRMSLNGFFDMLGADPLQRCYHVCRIVFGATPTTHGQDIQPAFEHLADLLESMSGSRSDDCAAMNGCDLTLDLRQFFRPSPQNTLVRCRHCRLWRAVISALERGYSALAIDAAPQTPAKFDLYYLNKSAGNLPDFNDLMSDGSPRTLQSRSWSAIDVHNWLMRVPDPSENGRRSWENSLAISTGSTTIYPAILNKLEVNLDEGFRYNLIEGQLYIKGRPYHHLVSAHAGPRRRASEISRVNNRRIKPSSSGVHSHLAFTIQESLEALKLRVNMVAQGHSIQIDLSQILYSYMGLNDAPQCDHNRDAELAAEFLDDVRATSVAAPQVGSNRFAIVQTKDDPTAQLLACGPDAGLLLQRRSCLNCAVKYAQLKNLDQIIAA